MTDCEMKAVQAEAKTSVAPAIQPGRLSGRMTRKKLRHIPAPKAGTVKRILVEDGTPVEYGAPLLIIE